MDSLISLGCECCGDDVCDIRCDPVGDQTYDETDRYSSVTISGATGMLASTLNGTWAIGPEDYYRMQDLPGRPCMNPPDNLPGIGDPLADAGCHERIQIKRPSGIIKHNFITLTETPREYYQEVAASGATIVNHIIHCTGHSSWAVVTEGYWEFGDCDTPEDHAVTAERTRLTVQFTAYHPGGVRGDRTVRAFARRFLGVRNIGFGRAWRRMIRTQDNRLWMPGIISGTEYPVFFNRSLVSPVWQIAPYTSYEQTWALPQGEKSDGSFGFWFQATTLTEVNSDLAAQTAIIVNPYISTVVRQNSNDHDRSHQWSLYQSNTYTTCNGLKSTKTMEFYRPPTYSASLSITSPTSLQEFDGLGPLSGLPSGMYTTIPSSEQPATVIFEHPDIDETQNISIKLNP